MCVDFAWGASILGRLFYKKHYLCNMKKQFTGAVMGLVVGAAATFTAVEQANVTPEPVKIEYDGDQWERSNSIHNGLFTGIYSSGDMIGDLSMFLFGQGGGKSRDPRDQITHLPNAWPPVPDKDGYKYHTVNDVTWILFTNPKIAAFAGYKPTPQLFYSMPDSIRRSIIIYHIQQASVTKSICVNLVFTYALWGGGGYKPTLDRFEQRHGDINAAIDSCEYFVFYKCLEYRQEIMRERNQKVWPIYGKGWSNGLANFHRVFKHYTRTKSLSNETNTISFNTGNPVRGNVMRRAA